jgi:hypothetical protein
VSEVDILFDENDRVVLEGSYDSRAGNYNKIMDLVNDPDAPLTLINRMIAVEMANVIKEISGIASNPLSQVSLKTREAQVKSLRELSKTLQENETLSKRDVLNFDGPKFQYAVREIVTMMKKSIIQAGYPEEKANDILRTFRDMMAVREPELRREVEKVEITKSEK